MTYQEAIAVRKRQIAGQPVDRDELAQANRKIEHERAMGRVRMFLRFFPEQFELAELFAKQHVGRSPAAIQGALVANRADALAACHAMRLPLPEAA